MHEPKEVEGQADLFISRQAVEGPPPPAPPFQRHSPTSRAAAASVKESAPTLREAVLRLLRDRGPGTDHEIAAALGIDGSTARPRRVELVRLGLVEDSGKQALTPSGRKAVIWRAKGEG